MRGNLLTVPDDAMPAEPRVVIPPGAGLLQAAAWVGHACWAELRWHEVLTAWLSAEIEHVSTATFWSLRADAGERAAAWHRRLPELREHPRHGFVRTSRREVAAAFDQLAELAEPEGAGHRLTAAVAVLSELASGYRRHLAVAVGPADAPVLATLTTALSSVNSGRRVLIDPTLRSAPLPVLIPPLP